jgi:putative SOS response-associated peptidase YedK
MCGRFTHRNPDPAPFPEFSQHWPQVPPRYNIAPSTEVLVLRQVDGEPRAELARWGLRPKWLKDASKAQINARSETAAEKPFFRATFAHDRCLFVADGWFEWRAEAGRKQPYFFHRRDDGPFTIAGLWTASTCAILTVAPNPLAARVHDRMPVLVGEAERQRWLDPTTPRDQVQALCRPWTGDDLEVFPVSTRVNAPRHDDPECIAPVGPALG